MASSSPRSRSVRRSLIRLHRWLGVGAALIWMIQALTGLMMTFHFEAEDALASVTHRPTDPAAIERRMDAFADAGGDAAVNWIWTTAGLPDRYLIDYAAADGSSHRARIDGAGNVIEDRGAGDSAFFPLLLEIHQTLAAGTVGHWVLAASGLLLVTNLAFGLAVAWPGRGRWREALVPTNRGNPSVRLYSWHRAVGMWAVIPGMLIAGTGTLMLFENELRAVLGVPEVALPANPAKGDPVGFAAASQAAAAAIPGSRFVGTTLPSAGDASYYAWVRAPGELYRGGYGGSLVVVDANDGSIRGAWPAGEAKPAARFVGSLYPLHTGEAGGLIGRILCFFVGLWLVTMTVAGVLLWLRRRPVRKRAA